jgi:hydantoinase/carbamoylase family amidase
MSLAPTTSALAGPASVDPDCTIRTAVAAPENLPAFGARILAQAETLAAWSDDPIGLTCAYLGAAHRRTAAQLAQWMQEAGMQASIDVLGNVIGRYDGYEPDAGTLVTGSHYDTVRNGGKYDGRLGILLPIAVVAYLHARGERLPYHLEVIGFAEEEGVRFKSTFLGSSAIIGQFDFSLLEATDAQAISLRTALIDAGRDAATLEADIAALARDPATLLGYVEVHIEQGPVLLARGLPAGVVTAIAGSCRYLVSLRGTASHAGTTPMHMRQDAAAAAAQIILAVEARCSADAGGAGQGRDAAVGGHSLVGTVGQLHVPGGSVNVIAGACELSLDIRAADDAVRDAAVADLLREIERICSRRGVTARVAQILRAPSAPCAPWLMDQVAAAAERCGVPAFHLPSGAGHDAMLMARITDAAMLFTRCGNGGISHNPRESLSADDADVSARIFLDLLRHFTPLHRMPPTVRSGGTGNTSHADHTHDSRPT